VTERAEGVVSVLGLSALLVGKVVTRAAIEIRPEGRHCRRITSLEKPLEEARLIIDRELVALIASGAFLLYWQYSSESWGCY
jgi:hypothetical protein